MGEGHLLLMRGYVVEREVMVCRRGGVGGQSVVVMVCVVYLGIRML